MSYVRLVDPDRMLRVELADARLFNVLDVRYVLALDSTGAKRIAVELDYDPQHQAPVAPYHCPVSRVVPLLVPPAHVKRIQPYRP